MIPRFLRRFFVVLVVLVAVIALGAVVLPWKTWLENRLASYLDARNIHNTQVKITHVGLDGVTLENVTIGDKTPLTLQKLTLGYSLPALLGNDLQVLTVSGLMLEARQEKQGWVIGGLESWPNNRAPDKTAIVLPVTNGELQVLPLQAIKLVNSHLQITAKGWQADLPLDMQAQKAPSPNIAYDGMGLMLKAGDIVATTGQATVQVALTDGMGWSGSWVIDDIKVTGIGGDLPLFKGKGTLNAKKDRIAIDGKIGSDDGAYQAAFNLDYSFNAPEKSTFTFTQLSMPWYSGTVGAQNVRFSFGDHKPVTVQLDIHQVALASVMQQMVGDKASALGQVSGILPVTITDNGTLELHEGKLLADGPGVIALSPDVIPGDNPQVALARDVLKNFHYTTLSAAIDSAPDKKLTLLLNVEGSNPDAVGGKPVKLAVHLTGDVLNLIQQNMTLADPKKLLEQGKK